MYILALIFPLWTCWHMSFPEKPKHAHCLLYIPPLTSTLSPSIIFTFSQLSAAHHFKKKPFIMLRVCMCVNCQYKTALAWAQMKTLLTGDWWISALEVLADVFFYMAVRLLCMWRKSDSLVDSCKSQVNVNLKRHSQPIFLGETGYSKIKKIYFKYILLFIYPRLSLSCTVTLSFHLVGTFIFYLTLSVNTYCCFS